MIGSELRRLALCVAVLLPTAAWAQRATLAVPSQYPTIQAAVNAAVPGSVVRVAPGTYRENLIVDKSVFIVSSGGAAVTTIDGRAVAPVFQVRGTSTETVQISGFKITNGFVPNTDFSAGGIDVQYVDRIWITDNIISANVSCFGPGVWVSGSSLQLHRNVISDNVQPVDCGGIGGGAVYQNGGGRTASAITLNAMSGHSVNGYGGAIAVNAVEDIAIRSNLIRNNSAVDYGGAVWFNLSSGEITSNVIINNNVRMEGSSGGGLAVFAAEPTNRVRINGNTFNFNSAVSQGSGVLIVSYYEGGVTFTDNSLQSNGMQSLLSCVTTYGLAIPRSNRFISPQGVAIDGSCELAPRGR